MDLFSKSGHSHALAGDRAQRGNDAVITSYAVNFCNAKCRASVPRDFVDGDFDEGGCDRAASRPRPELIIGVKRMIFCMVNEALSPKELPGEIQVSLIEVNDSYLVRAWVAWVLLKADCGNIGPTLWDTAGGVGQVDHGAENAGE